MIGYQAKENDERKFNVLYKTIVSFSLITITGQFPDGQLPDGQFPDRTIPRTDNSPTGQFPDCTIP